MGEDYAAIFEIQMLEDEDFMDAIHNMIRSENVNVEYAVAVTGNHAGFK